ncbi:MAG: hypothetical protein HDR53_03160, partial [Treponema sp.]|nr:hypothetical protein [Treponema sp.]
RNLAPHIPVRLPRARCAGQGEGGEHERDSRVGVPCGGAFGTAFLRAAGLHVGAAAYVRDGSRGVRNPSGNGGESICGKKGWRVRDGRGFT